MRIKIGEGVVWLCDKCGGRLVGDEDGGPPKPESMAYVVKADGYLTCDEAVAMDVMGS